MAELKQPSQISHIKIEDGIIPGEADQFLAELFQKNEVVVISDTNHKNGSIPRSLASMIPTVSKEQPLLVFLEFSRSEQAAVDRYFETGDAKNLEKFVGLKEDEMAAMKSDLRPIMVEARGVGAKVYGMDLAHKDKMTVKDSETLYNKSLYVQRHGQPGKEAEAEKEFEEQLAAFKQGREDANAKMVDLIKEKRDEFMRANPGVNPKILVMVGAGHTRNDRHPVREDIDEMLAEKMDVNTVNVAMQTSFDNPMRPFVKPGGSMGGVDAPEFTIYLPNENTLERRDANKGRIGEYYQKADALLGDNALANSSRIEREKLAAHALNLQAGVDDVVKDLKIYTTPPDLRNSDQQDEFEKRKDYNDPKQFGAMMQVAGKAQAGLEEVTNLMSQQEPDYRLAVEKLREVENLLKPVDATYLERMGLGTALSSVNVLASKQYDNDKSLVESKPDLLKKLKEDLNDQVAGEAIGMAKALGEDPSGRSQAVGEAWRTLAGKVDQLVEERLKDSQEPMTPGARRIVARELATSIYKEAKIAGTAPKNLSERDKPQLGAGEHDIDAKYVQRIYNRLNDEGKPIEQNPPPRVAAETPLTLPATSEAPPERASAPAVDPKRLEAAVEAIATLDIGRMEQDGTITSREVREGKWVDARDKVISDREMSVLGERTHDGYLWSAASKQENAKVRANLLDMLDLDGDGKVVRDELDRAVEAAAKAGLKFDAGYLASVLGDDVKPNATPNQPAGGRATGR